MAEDPSSKLQAPKWSLEDLFPTDNAVFSGGFGLAILASGAQFLRMGSTVGIQMMKRHLLVTLEVTSKDKSYPWILQWLYARGNRTQHLSVETSFKPTASTKKNGANGGNMKIDFVPGPGRHVLKYKGQYMLINRVREQQMVDLNTGKPWEKVQFTSIGRNTSVFQDILDEAYELSAKQEDGKTIIFTNWGAEWRQFGQPRKKRPIDSVILDRGVSDRIIGDVYDWLSSYEWYSNRGIPYRRGYLLHGSPGSGKSSFIMALAGSLNYNICILNLAERGLTDDRLALALSMIPPQSLVLLEDIDAAFPNRDRDFIAGGVSTGHNDSNDVTFSGLLNVLDGVASSEERLVFMTTNYIERLDAALIRPGRVDYVQSIGDATDYQVVELFRRFYPLSEAVPPLSSTVESSGLSSSGDVIREGTVSRVITNLEDSIDRKDNVVGSNGQSSSNSSISNSYGSGIVVGEGLKAGVSIHSHSQARSDVRVDIDVNVGIQDKDVDKAQLVDSDSDSELVSGVDEAVVSKAETFLSSLRATVGSKGVSMACLQGHLLRYKDSADEAIQNLPALAPPSSRPSPSSAQTTTDCSEATLQSMEENKEEKEKARAELKKNYRVKKPLTVEQVDSMYFNPQDGWDTGVKEI